MDREDEVNKIFIINILLTSSIPLFCVSDGFGDDFHSRGQA